VCRPESQSDPLPTRGYTIEPWKWEEAPSAIQEDHRKAIDLIVKELGCRGIVLAPIDNRAGCPHVQGRCEKCQACKHGIRGYCIACAHRIVTTGDDDE
jgi:hypothetical protein